MEFDNITDNDTLFEEKNFTSNKNIPWMYDLGEDDANWVMTSSFIIFTMQTGFGLLESGAVSIKNEVNIMMKNVVDIVLGGLSYWMFGYGISFGRSEWTNPFFGFGDFFLNPSIDDPFMGPMFAAFLFQLSFATTATTIVSGAMAERCNFRAYCLFSALNTIIYCVPARWVWGDDGFLKNLGAVDIAGSGPVHLVGGSSAFASAWMLGPRLGRYINGIEPLPLGCPVNAAMGLFVLWWGWLAFNSGSTYGLSGQKWHYAGRAAVMTMISSFGGGLWGLTYTLVITEGETIDLMIIINSILGSLVSITAGCFLYNSWESLLIGIIGGILVCVTTPFFDKISIDDPVGASSVHGLCGIWGVLAVGLFASDPKPLDTTNGRNGVLIDGTWYLFGIQAFTCLCLILWSSLTTIFLLWFVNKIIPIRMEPHMELLGADLSEHKIRHGAIGISRALSALKPVLDHNELLDVTTIGFNPGHDAYLHDFYSITHNKNPNIKSTTLLTQKMHSNDLKILKKSNILPVIERSVIPTMKIVTNLTFKDHRGEIIKVTPNEKNKNNPNLNNQNENENKLDDVPAKLAWID